MRVVASVLGPFYFVFYVCERIIWKAARRLLAGQSCYTTGLLIWITMPHCVSVWNIFQKSAHTQEQPIGESLCRWIIAVFVLSIEYYILPCPKNINLQWILVFSISFLITYNRFNVSSKGVIVSIQISYTFCKPIINLF